MDEKQHLVPQFVLRRFSDDRGKIAMRDRITGQTRVMSVEKVAKEGNFYNLESPVRVDESGLANLREGNPTVEQFLHERDDGVYLDGRAVESLLALIEGETSRIVDAMVRGSFPLDMPDRVMMTLFMAFQFCRGRRFRSDLTTLSQEILAIRIDSYLSRREGERYAREWLKRNGKVDGDAAVARFLEQLRANRPTTSVSRGGALRFMMETARDAIAPELHAKAWRLLRFPTPDLVISDEPVAMWTRPGRDLDADPPGIQTADIVFFPIDAGVCLQLLNPGPHVEEDVPNPPLARLHQANESVAGNANRWIFHRPDRDPLAGMRLPPPDEFAFEQVPTSDDQQIFRLHRQRSRPGA